MSAWSAGMASTYWARVVNLPASVLRLWNSSRSAICVAVVPVPGQALLEDAAQLLEHRT